MSDGSFFFLNTRSLFFIIISLLSTVRILDFKTEYINLSVLYYFGFHPPF